jgi:aspartyl-tRNA(Asn)/glutamyl-tRNA(Gln) amidotransferase subunit B
MGALSARLNDLGITIREVKLTPERLAGLIRLIDAGTISGPVTRDVFEKMFTSENSAAEIVEREGLARIDDQDAIVAAIREVLAANPQPVAQYRAGKQQTFGFLVGKVMKETKGKANPAVVNDLLRRLLSEDEAE